MILITSSPNLKERAMYEITPRKQGQCDFCSETEVVTLTKNGKTNDWCKKHLWEALHNGQKKAKKKPEQK
jgi:hypothetical protein